MATNGIKSRSGSMPSSGQSRTSGDESAESVIPSRADQTDTFLISARGTISPASRASEDFRLSGPKQHLKRPWLAWLLKSSNLDNCATPRKGLVWLLRSGRRPTRPRPELDKSKRHWVVLLEPSDIMPRPRRILLRFHGLSQCPHNC